MADSLKDELIARQAAPAATMSNTAESGVMAMPAYADPERVKAINNMYDANVNAQKANLQTSYDQNMSNLEANRESIAKRYQAQRNAAATDYERQRRNFNEQAMMNGLATGVGSQAALAQNAAYQKQQGTINAAEGTDVSGLERSIADLKVKYQNDINSAIADNDYKRAAAMLDEYNMAYNRAQQEAQTKAQYGDFSGYESMYGAETANQMRDVWLRQNPGIAYSLGYIGADMYYALTGKYPAGYSSGGSKKSYSRTHGGSTQPPEGGVGGGDTVSADEIPESIWRSDLALANALQKADNAMQAGITAREAAAASTDAARQAGKGIVVTPTYPTREVARSSPVWSTR